MVERRCVYGGNRVNPGLSGVSHEGTEVSVLDVIRYRLRWEGLYEEGVRLRGKTGGGVTHSDER